ncbi:MAG: hypothetical protein CSA35_03515 [Dethiosulfovibrio peptidovorans]|nr:MAG: hypothetical protein CSA35_03515 [Dethiosulfovibrio peptidovorans]
MKKHLPWGLLATVLAVLVWRTWALQVHPESRTLTRLSAQTGGIARTFSNRGMIVDRRGEPLALSVPAASLYVDPQIWDTKQAHRLKGLIPPQKVRSLSSPMKGRFFWLDRQIKDVQAKKILELGLDGLFALQENRRSYPNGALLSHVLGVCDIDGHGLSGLERIWDDVLFTPAQWSVRIGGRDGREGEKLKDGIVRLTIDRRIQYILEKHLFAAAMKEKAKWGAALCIESESGRILGMASWPTFDGNKRESMKTKNMVNCCISRVYEPGSTLKPIVMAMALQSGIVSKRSHFLDRGRIKVADGWISNSHGTGKGKIDLPHVLIYSSNVAMAQIGMKWNPYEAYKDLQAWGVGHPTGVELNGEESGLLLPPERWYGVIPSNVAIGQGVAITPLQLTMAFNAIANGGRLLRPHVVDEVQDSHGKVVYRSATEVVRNVLSSQYVRWFRNVLRKVVTEGTGKEAECSSVKIGGKTGTAQVAEKGTYKKERMVGSFIGYWPYDDPQYTLLVVLGEPRAGRYYGGEVAAPPFRFMVEDIERLDSGE